MVELDRFEGVILTEEVKMILLDEFARKIDSFRTYIYTMLINEHGLYDGIEADRSWMDGCFLTVLAATEAGLQVGRMYVYDAVSYVEDMDKSFGEFLAQVGARYAD